MIENSVVLALSKEESVARDAHLAELSLKDGFELMSQEEIDKMASYFPKGFDFLAYEENYLAEKDIDRDDIINRDIPNMLVFFANFITQADLEIIEEVKRLLATRRRHIKCNNIRIASRRMYRLYCSLNEREFPKKKPGFFKRLFTRKDTDLNDDELYDDNM